jgi:hypothetical protein
MLISSFVKIGPLVQSWKGGTHTLFLFEARCTRYGFDVELVFAFSWMLVQMWHM